MRIQLIAAIAALGIASNAVEAVAQSDFTPQQLDQMSKERQQELGQRNWGPPPPQSTVPQDNLRQPSKLLVCMSTDAWKPVYGAPSKTAAVIGKTLPQIAVSGKNVDGFTPVVFGAGQTGYVPADEIRPFSSSVNPDATCSIAGLRPNGAVVFSIR